MRVLGLDFSSQGTFAVSIDSAFGRFEVRDTYHIPSGGEVDRILQFRYWYDSLPKKPDRIIVALPSSSSTFRNIQIATRDKKAIRAAIQFEVEDDLPFESDHIHYDSVTMSQNSDGSSVHVAALKRETLEAFLLQYTEKDVEPDVVTTEVWAYRGLLARIAPENTALLLSIEEQKTMIYIHQGTKPILHREIPFGKANIVQRLADSFGSHPDEIASWIRDVGMSGTDEKIGRVIADVLDPLVSEIKQSELAARALTKNNIEQIFLTGEMALMPGLIQWVESTTGKQASILRPLRAISPQQLSYSDQTEVQFTKALGLALTVIAIDKLPVLNFRKGAYAKSGAEDDQLLRSLKHVIPYAAVVLLTLFATKFIESQYYKTRLETADDTLRIAVKNYFGGIADSAARTYMSSPAKLKQTVQADLLKERELSKLFNASKNSPLDLLKTISTKVGRDIVLDMVKFESGTDSNEAFDEARALKTNLVFLVTNPQHIAKLADSLDKNFEMKKDSSEETKIEGKTQYRVSFSGQIGAGKIR